MRSQRSRSLGDHSSEVVGRVTRALAGIAQVGAADVDVADLPARAHALAVDVDLGAGVAGHDVAVGRVEVLVVAAEDVGHDGPRRPWPGVAEREVEDSAKVLLELPR